MKLSFELKKVLLLDTPFNPEYLKENQAVIGTINGEYVFMNRITEEKLEQIFEIAKAESELGTYDLIKKQYEDFKIQMKEMYKLEREILNKLQEHCPHSNTYEVDDEFLGFDEDPYNKCKDCGKIIK